MKSQELQQVYQSLHLMCCASDILSKQVLTNSALPKCQVCPYLWGKYPPPGPQTGLAGEAPLVFGQESQPSSK